MDRMQRIIMRYYGKASHNDLIKAAEKAASQAGIPVEDFLDWAFDNLAHKYKEERMNRRILLENAVKNLALRLPNGTVKKDYKAYIEIPKEIYKDLSDVKFEGIDDIGLNVEEIETGKFLFFGKPSHVEDCRIKMVYNTTDGEPLSILEIPVAFNPNPRDLWRNIPTHKDILFYKPDSDCTYVKVESEFMQKKDMVGASQRGRSHAQEGKPRDDHFLLNHDENSDWYVMAVADGAGSAKYSRKGAEVACNTIVNHCKTLLYDNYEFDTAIQSWASDRDNEEKRTKVTRYVIDIVFKGAIRAHEAIKNVAVANPETKLRDFATTLMFAICKKYDFGWFIASFWVGDGAMCIYDENTGTAKLLGTPDEGEFSGQTRFLTMPEIFHDKDVISKRLRMTIVPDFTALFLMSDGVSDPMFETDKNLNDPLKWKEFYEKIKNGFPEDGIGGVDLIDNNENSKQQLLQWLDFWSPGNHDDRTIAILY